MRHPDDSDLLRIFQSPKAIAVVGFSAKPDRPSHYVAQYLAEAGFQVLGINPGLAGQTFGPVAVFASLSDIPETVGEIGMVDIFRREDDIPPVVDDAIAALSARGLETIWMQLGLHSEPAAQMAEDAGLNVVSNLCTKVEHARLKPRL